MGIKLITTPTTEPITLSEAKSHLKVSHNEEDDLIDAEISTAREWCENFQNRVYYTQEWMLTFDDITFGKIEIPKPPLQSIDSVEIKQKDESIVTVSSDNYYIDTISEPGRLYVAEWPDYDELYPMGAVQITFTAGKTDVSNINENVKQAMKLLIAHMYENRQAVLTTEVPRKLMLGVKSLLWQNRQVPV